jgi:anti-sigma-K factor RskA
VSTDSHVEELIAFYALGALPRDERQAVERHLAGCESCRALAVEAQMAARVLPFAAEPVAPAPAVKQRLMARIAADVATTTAPAPARARPGATGRSAAPPRLRWTWTVAAVAALALIGVLGWWGWTQQNELAAARAELEILSRPDLRVVSLPVAKPPQGGAQARLFVAPDSTTGLLAVSGLQPLPTQQTYEFWLIRGGKAIPAGIFNVAASGAGRLVVQSTDPLGQFDQAGVTVELAGGSQTPTMEALVFVGSIR